jgi:hypothetical protein
MSFRGLPDRSQFLHSERMLTAVDGPRRTDRAERAGAAEPAGHQRAAPALNAARLCAHPLPPEEMIQRSEIGRSE